MGELWTLRRRLDAWLEVELAVCEAWTRLGVIDEESMQAIRDKADFDVNLSRSLARDEIEWLIDNLASELSGREMSVLRCKAEGLSYDEIAARLCISKKSVDNSLTRIRKKHKLLMP